MLMQVSSGIFLRPLHQFIPACLPFSLITLIRGSHKPFSLSQFLASWYAFLTLFQSSFQLIPSNSGSTSTSCKVWHAIIAIKRTNKRFSFYLKKLNFLIYYII